MFTAAAVDDAVVGRHQEGETFFTALRRSFSSGSESELEQHEVRTQHSC
jgi:hypothetical protein